MKQKLRTMAVVVLVLTAAGCATPFDPAPYTTTEGLGSLMSSEETVLVLDVRSPGEYESRHIPGALNVPLDDLEVFLEGVDRKTIVVTYCEMGGRSGSAQRTLEEFRFRRVVNFVSIDNWTGEVATGSDP